MNIEMDQWSARATPASAMRDYVADHVSALMVLGGIEAISSQRHSCGGATVLRVSISPFHEAPAKIREQGIVLKDAIAQVMSVANVSRMVLKPTEDEMLDMRTTWANAVNDADSVNGGSGRDSAKTVNEAS